MNRHKLTMFELRAFPLIRTMLSYNLFQKLKLIENFNHLISTLTRKKKKKKKKKKGH
jgi:ribosomal protein L1